MSHSRLNVRSSAGEHRSNWSGSMATSPGWTPVSEGQDILAVHGSGHNSAVCESKD
jgi:hypothetical protein